VISPTHLALAASAGLMVSGPLRAAWARSDAGAGLGDRLPEILSLTFILALLGYMTQYAHPFGQVWITESARPMNPGEAFQPQAIGLLSIMLQSGILMGVVLAALMRRPLPFGSLTLILGLSAALMTIMRAHQLSIAPSLLITAAVATGFLCDLLARALRPSPARAFALRVLAFAVPVVLYSAYVLTLWLTDGLWWSVHLATGAIALAGIAGWLLSYLAVPAASL